MFKPQHKNFNLGGDARLAFSAKGRHPQKKKEIHFLYLNLRCLLRYPSRLPPLFLTLSFVETQKTKTKKKGIKADLYLESVPILGVVKPIKITRVNTYRIEKSNSVEYFVFCKPKKGILYKHKPNNKIFCKPIILLNRLELWSKIKGLNNT